MESEDERSPLISKNLRSPGQSCDERRRQLLEDKLLTPLLTAVLLTVYAALEAWRAYSNQPPAPAVAAFFAIAAIAFAVYRFKTVVPEVRRLKLAGDGEKAVGQLLERLRSQGYWVLHDIPAESFNVDHVLVGAAGVFCFETKTWTKPRSGEAKVTFDGKTLLKAGLAPDRDPVMQAKAQASWVRRLIEDGTGWKVNVKPAILIPGWFIDASQRTGDLWVLEPKAVPDFLAREPSRLQPEEVRMIAYHLSRYVRTFDQS